MVCWKIWAPCDVRLKIVFFYTAYYQQALETGVEEGLINEDLVCLTSFFLSHFIAQAYNTSRPRPFHNARGPAEDWCGPQRLFHVHLPWYQLNLWRIQSSATSPWFKPDFVPIWSCYLLYCLLKYTCWEIAHLCTNWWLKLWHGVKELNLRMCAWEQVSVVCLWLKLAFNEMHRFQAHK